MDVDSGAGTGEGLVLKRNSLGLGRKKNSKGVASEVDFGKMKGHGRIEVD